MINQRETRTTRRRNQINRHRTGEYRSFNVLGHLFEISLEDLNGYPSTFLADSIRLQSYWNPQLNSYFLSRNVQIFERTLLPFYRSKRTSNRIQYTSMISITEKQFRDELKFYDLIEYYQIDQIQIFLLEFSHFSSSSMNKSFQRFVLSKCLCRHFVDLISSISCSIGIFEIILRRCSTRHWIFILIDICLSLILLSIFFYEQFIDRIWLKIQSKLHRHFHDEIHLNSHLIPLVLVSYQSLIFIVQLLLSSFSFIIPILSFSNTNRWHFILSIAFRHLLLMRLCLADFCHFIDLLVYSGRSSLLVLSRFFVFLLTILFVCVWFGLIVFITDSNSNDEIFPPSRYVYFIYQILFNVGYGDTIERTFLSFLLIVLMSLIFSPFLLIIFENFLQQSTVIIDEFIHVKTFHPSSILDEFIESLRRLHSTKKTNKLID